MKRPAPIAVRPRKGSDLERLWEDLGRDNKQMGETIHGWAFAQANKEKGEQDD